ncbi:MAG: aminoglycoside adenylyltransferase domain-containing protein [Bacillota bacterium]
MSREAVAWGVLGVTRLYHVIVEGSVVSKSGAGEYALAHLPQWRGIVTEALQARKGGARSEYRNPFVRRREMIDYMNYIIDECNKAS